LVRFTGHFRSSGQQQPRVTELVPEVALGDRSVVGALAQLKLGDRFDQQQVRGLRVMPPG
jgi:hypothetical protein